jgi:hypothetical protein
VLAEKLKAVRALISETDEINCDPGSIAGMFTQEAYKKK